VTSKVFKTQVKLHYWAGVALAYCKYPKTYLFALIALFSKTGLNFKHKSKRNRQNGS
jgi:hypothetical protein